MNSFTIDDCIKSSNIDSLDSFRILDWLRDKCFISNTLILQFNKEREKQWEHIELQSWSVVASIVDAC